MSTLITGANGFLGKYIVNALGNQAYITLGLWGCDYNIDLSASMPEFANSFQKVIHAAGLAHIEPGNKAAVNKFLNVNVKGTANLLAGLENLKKLPETFFFISTVAVYGIDQGEEIDESAPLKGSSPYALSKIEAEKMILKWGKKNNVKTLILRLPLVAGVNPPGNLGAMIRAIRKGYYFSIGEGNARKSIVLAEDVAGFTASCPPISGIYNLTDGYHPTIRQLEQLIADQTDRKLRKISYKTAKLIASAGDWFPFLPVNTEKLGKLTTSLTFSDKKARNEVGWKSRPVIDYLKIFL